MFYDTYTIVDSNGDPIEGVYIQTQRLRYRPSSTSNAEGRIQDNDKKDNGDRITLVKYGYGHACVVKTIKIFTIYQTISIYLLSQEIAMNIILLLQKPGQRKTENCWGM